MFMTTASPCDLEDLYMCCCVSTEEGQTELYVCSYIYKNNVAVGLLRRNNEYHLYTKPHYQSCVVCQEFVIPRRLEPFHCHRWLEIQRVFSLQELHNVERIINTTRP